MKKIVTVEYLYDGIINEWESERGVLIDGDMVFVCGIDGVLGVYNAIQTDRPDVFLVDLDGDGQDFFEPQYFAELVV